MSVRNYESSIFAWIRNCLLDVSTVEVISSKILIQVQAVYKFEILQNIVNVICRLLQEQLRL